MSTQTHTDASVGDQVHDQNNASARDEYVDDFMQRVDTVAQQNATLRARAPARIHQAVTEACKCKSTRSGRRSRRRASGTHPRSNQLSDR